MSHLHGKTNQKIKLILMEEAKVLKQEAWIKQSVLLLLLLYNGKNIIIYDGIKIIKKVYYKNITFILFFYNMLIKYSI